MMRSLFALTTIALLLTLSPPADAELQNVQADGKLVIGGNWFDWEGHNYSWIEQRTLLGVQADFTDNVGAYIQFDNYSVWGEDFRSQDWETGVDERATIQSGPYLPYVAEEGERLFAEVEVYQAYIEARELWGSAFDMRLGRQELVYGAEWLIGNNDNGWGSRGLSFDALRVDYNHDSFMISGVVSKLDETVIGDLFEEDLNMYMLYGSYRGIENTEIDGYIIYVDDDRDPGIVLPKAKIGTSGGEALTFGIRVGGFRGPVDYEFDIAYQDQDPNEEYIIGNKEGFMALDDDGFAALHTEFGYNFKYECHPRLFIGGAWYEGTGDGTGFNRLFSDIRYSQFPDFLFHNQTNLIVLWAGVESHVTENIVTEFKVSYFEIDDAGGYYDFISKQPAPPVWVENPDDLGWEVEAIAHYHYSEDLVFGLTYAHFFGGDALHDEDSDYVGISSTIHF